MTIQDLKDTAQLEREIEEIKNRIEAMEAKLFYAKGIKIDGMPHNNANKDITDLYNSYIELKDTYQKKLAMLTETIKKVVDAAEKLPTVERRAIQLRYIDGKPISIVAQEMGYEQRQVYRILKAAEAKICQ